MKTEFWPTYKRANLRQNRADSSMSSLGSHEKMRILYKFASLVNEEEVRTALEIARSHQRSYICTRLPSSGIGQPDNF